jgi:hypothetical protein
MHMEARTGSGWKINEGQFECARQFLTLAERSTNHSDRQSFGRAGLKLLCGSLGICGTETQGAAYAPVPAREIRTR